MIIVFVWFCYSIINVVKLSFFYVKVRHKIYKRRLVKSVVCTWLYYCMAITQWHGWHTCMLLKISIPQMPAYCRCKHKRYITAAGHATGAVT